VGSGAVTHRVAVLAGDGIGPEVTAAATRVLRAVLPSITFDEAPVGAAAIASHGVPLPPEALHAAHMSEAILFGAVGGPGFDHLPPERRPEAAILGLRKTFNLYANVRPSRAFPGLEDRSPLRAEIVRGMDCVIVRELTGGLYFGEKRIESDDVGVFATETLTYHDFEIERIARFAFELARTRRRHVTSIDKNNVLVSSQLWRRIVTKVAEDYADVTLAHMLVDNAAMQLLRDPRAFDVIVTENMFGDILSDEAAMATGTIGNAPSASLGAPPNTRAFGLYEPISGTAPDIAGRGIANPTGAILSAAMLARFSLGEPDAAWRIENAVAEALAAGPRTADLDSQSPASTEQFTDAVLSRVGEPVMSDAALRMGV
jgi:3-isopropylmalate dehydrogenase